MVRVALEGEEEGEQARAAKNLEVYRLRCVIKDATAGLAIGEAMGADLLLWGEAVCPWGRAGSTAGEHHHDPRGEGQRADTYGPIEAHVNLPKAEAGSFCARASLTAKGWPAMGSGSAESRSASVLELGSLELPQVVAGDALGLTLFVGGLHFYKRDDYPRALRLFRSTSEKLRTDSRSAAELLQVMGLTEYRAGRFDKAADYLARCESLATGDSDTWWVCRMTQVNSHYLAAHLPQAQVLAEEALQRSRAEGRRAAEAKALMRLGDLALRVDEWKEARGRFEEALALCRASGDRRGEADTLMRLGDLALRVDELKEARGRYEEALALYRAIGSRLGEANTLWSLGDVALRVDELKEARGRMRRRCHCTEPSATGWGRPIRCGAWENWRCAYRS